MLRVPALLRTALTANRPPLTAAFCATAHEGLVDCARVRVFENQFGAGAYAAQDIAKGELVESGIVRVLTDVDGNVNPYVFTWSDEVPNTTWAIGSGAST